MRDGSGREWREAEDGGKGDGMEGVEDGGWRLERK